MKKQVVHEHIVCDKTIVHTLNCTHIFKIAIIWHLKNNTKKIKLCYTPFGFRELAVRKNTEVSVSDSIAQRLDLYISINYLAQS
jgi:hypothetical protein